MPTPETTHAVERVHLYPVTDSRSASASPATADLMRSIERRYGYPGPLLIGCVEYPDMADGEGPYPAADCAQGNMHHVRFKLGALPRAVIEAAHGEIAWDGTELTFRYRTGAGDSLGSVRYDVLTRGQTELGMRVRSRTQDLTPIYAAASEIDDTVAAIAATLGDLGEVDERDDDLGEGLDREGVLGFAHDLERAGVASWPEPDILALTAVATGWAGSSDDLLRTARAICVPAS